MRHPYQPNNPNTGVLTYELLPDGALILEFRNHARYLYTAERPGPIHLGEMTRRALAGQGLSSYVSQHVGERYARKLPA